MKAAFIGLISSKKAIITMLAVIAISVLCIVGKIGGEFAVDTIKWLVMAWVGAQALEDSKVKPALLNKPIKGTAEDP